MSEVEQLWNALRGKFNDERTWNELTAQQQNVFIQGINCFLAVVHRMV
jgi:hypothetical protein